MIRHAQRLVVAALGGWMMRSALEPGQPMPLLIGGFGLTLIICMIVDAARSMPSHGNQQEASDDR